MKLPFQNEKTSQWYLQTRTALLMLVGIIVALGQYSEAVSLIDDARDAITRRFTNTIEYGLISRVHIGNTRDYILELAGTPQVSKTIDADTTANYFYNDKFLLTLFFRQQRVSAYLLIALQEGFTPPLDRQSDFALGEFSYAQFNNSPADYSIDHSRTNTFYLEVQPHGSSALYLNSYLGNVDYGSGQVDPEQLNALYRAEVYGQADNETAVLQQFRKSAHPNVFGRGELTLAAVEASLLSATQFHNYFSR